MPCRSAFRLTAAAILVVAALAGCSDDDEETPPEESTSTTDVVEREIPTDSDDYATAFVDAWSRGDRDYADVLADDDAVDTIFAFEGGGTWTLVECEGAMGSSYCTYNAGGDPTLVIRVGNEAAFLGQPDAISEVRVNESDDVEGTLPEESTSTTDVAERGIPTDSEDYATAFVDAWSRGDRDYADVLGTNEAVDTIFAFEGGGTWTLVECEGAMGSSYCTYSAGGEPTLVVRVRNEAALLGQPDGIHEIRVNT